jgi:hypothetical protein
MEPVARIEISIKCSLMVRGHVGNVSIDGSLIIRQFLERSAI